jgi:hypothetical protein
MGHKKKFYFESAVYYSHRYSFISPFCMTYRQCFGSALIVCGSGSSILDECGFGYGSGSSADPEDSEKI